MHGRLTLLFCALLVLGVHSWLIAIGLNPVYNGGEWNLFWDPDSYTRLLRVQELARTQAWYDPTLHAANHPFGFALHWSRLLDVLLLVPAAVASVAMPFAEALRGWGLLIGPVLHLGGLMILSWGTRPFLSDRRFLLLGALFAVQRGIAYDFLPGLVDHHGLQVLLLVASLAALLRDPKSPRLACLAGALGALALWASVESLVLVLALVLGLGLHWVLEGGRADAKRLRGYGTGLAVGVAVALLLERPPAGLLEVSYERLSIVQLTLAGAVLLVAAGIAALVRARLARTAHGRLALAVAVSGAAVVALVFAFPALLRNPYGAAASVVRQKVLPAIAAEQLFMPTDPNFAYNFALEIGPGLVAFVYCVLRLWRRGALDAAERLRYALCAAAIVVLTAYATYAFRGVPFVAAAALVPWAEAILASWRRVREAAVSGLGRAGRTRALAVAVVVTAGPWLTAGAITAFWMERFVVSNAPACRWDLLSRYIPAPAGKEPSSAVLTDVFAGPEVAYRTGRPVLAAPYHGNGEGIEAAYAILSAAGEDAISLLDRRDIGWVTLCRWAGTDIRPVVEANPFGLGARLLQRIPPDGLVLEPLPAELRELFVLYRRVRKR